jgi:hypothetical protein
MAFSSGVDGAGGRIAVKPRVATGGEFLERLGFVNTPSLCDSVDLLLRRFVVTI